MKFKTALYYLMTLFLLGTVSMASIAQELCEVLAREAFEAVDENCAGVDAENACYGFNTLNATFNADIAAEASFEDPSDLVEVIQIHTVRTSAYDEEEEEWGIGYFQIPVADEDPVVVMMAGDVIVENAADPAAENANPLDTFNFTTAGSSDCRQTPNAVFIQSPPAVPVDLTINSTPIRLGSTVVIGTEYDENGKEIMWFSVLEGKVTIFPDTPEAQTINEGFYSTVVLSDKNGEGLNGEDALDSELVPVLDKVTGEPIIGPNGEPFYRRVPVTQFTSPEPLTEDGESFRGYGSYTFINDIPETLTNYDVEVPEPSPTATATLVPAVVNATATQRAILSGGTCADGNVNWCYAGQPWGDGRCDDPDPNISAWYWDAGYYNAQLECGQITALPEQFTNATPSATPTPVTPTATFTPSATVTPSATMTPTETYTPTSAIFTVTVTSCIISGADTSFSVTIAGAPVGTNLINMAGQDGNYGFGYTNGFENYSAPLAAHPFTTVWAISGATIVGQTTVTYAATCQ